MRWRIAASAGFLWLIPAVVFGQTPGLPIDRDGFNVNLYVSAGQPVLTHDAETVWRSGGGLDIVPGFGLRLGYRWHRVGLEGGFDITGANPRGRDGLGGGVYLMALLRVAPEHRFDPTIGVGFVREGLLADFNAGEFPLETIARNPDEPGLAGEAGTFGNGIRVDAGGNIGLSRTWNVTINGMADFLWFGTASYNDAEHSLQEKGVSVWPRVAVGLRWNP